ncbi:energy-coupling factor transporter ATPase [Erysipelothrix amsterdamensis]|uniref:Energy-coupling factor transporter ATP-binding protein EcfA2 n=1 Tax=Erysipelothrix amsterdamensis TaxID=2929157 RepID=A0AAU9VI80_9FIRM|nr:energy-coupling factor transporter ATPase [Erysipelothrix sp. 4322-04]WRB87095.1 energy-coupling factor transporter ATPase [Erysipelothrix sp. 4322-04]CAH2763047.1 energy-coupling factor transporter ATPase [Erysipelothrix sp. A18Y020d]CAH2763077.1 energy-coupling factor transporter ATPase [Erysipelothrix sp. A18Y020d]
MSITFEDVSYVYSPNSPFSHHALTDINTTLETGKITAIIGATGSGKSTLVQHLNGLIQPTSGVVTILDHKIKANDKTRNLKQLRSKVGLVFQFPEMQLFEETIYKDVAFGPKNFGFTEEQIQENVSRSLNLVGIHPDIWERSPLDLSGGQKRRVAIAGVLATNPDVIVLDEPTAGLDPQGSKDMMDLFVRLNKEMKKTVIMVTHDMDHVLRYADNVLVLNHGSVFYDGPVQDFFDDSNKLESLGFVAPKILQLKQLLKKGGFNSSTSLDLDEIAQMIEGDLK